MSFDFKKDHKWLWFFIGSLVVYTAIAFFSDRLTPEQVSIFYPLFSNFGGNLIAGVLSGVLFLFLGLYFSSETEFKIDKIVNVTIESEKKLKEREDQLKRERDIFRFKNFVANENFHNVRFPQLKKDEDDLGLEYTIYPIRDSKNNEPVKKTSEMYEYYLVKVKGPAYLSVSNSAQRKKYDDSPIRDGQNYFCSYFNDSWNMTSGDFSEKWYSFYFSSKMGHVEYGESANEFMGKRNDTWSGLTEVGKIQVDLDYKKLPPDFLGSFNSVPVFSDVTGNVFIQLHDSEPLKVYLTTKKQEVPETNWKMQIDPVRGYAFGEKLENLKIEIADFLSEKKIELKKIHWYNLPEDKQLID